MPDTKKQPREPEVHDGTIRKPPPLRKGVYWPETLTTVKELKEERPQS